MDADYFDDIELRAITPTQDDSLVHGLDQVAGDNGRNVNAIKTVFRCFNRKGAISTLNGDHME